MPRYSGSFSLREYRSEPCQNERSRVAKAGWLLIRPVFKQWWMPRAARVAILRSFGAQIGERVLIRHDVHIHWPWNLVVGDDSWIGERSWLLNLETVIIGPNTCISQEVLLCTGSHKRHERGFDSDHAPILVGESVWLAARSTVLRGVSIGDRAVVGATALVSEDVPADAMVRVAAPQIAERDGDAQPTLRRTISTQGAQNIQKLQNIKNSVRPSLRRV